MWGPLLLFGGNSVHLGMGVVRIWVIRLGRGLTLCGSWCGDQGVAKQCQCMVLVWPTTARRHRQTSKAHCMKTSSADGWIIIQLHTGYNSKPWRSKDVIEKWAWAFGRMVVIYPKGSKYRVSSRGWGRDYQRFSVLGRKEGTDVFCTQACDAGNRTLEYQSPINQLSSNITVCIAMVAPMGKAHK